MLTKIVAGLAGIAAAFAVIALTQHLGHRVYPPPPDLDVSDIEAFRKFTAGLPLMAFLFVLLAYYAGSLAGTFVAGWIAGFRTLIYAGLIGGLVLAGTVANLVMIPHPLWFSILAVIGIPLFAYLGSRLAPVRRVTQ